MRTLLLTACLACALLLDAPPVARAQGAVVDRVLAVVDGQLVTLSDVRTAAALRLVEGPDDAAVLAVLIDRLLVVEEASRYTVQEPSKNEIDARVAGLRDAVGEIRFATVLKEGGLSEASLRQHLRDDLVVASYMSQRFASAAMPTDSEVEEYLRTRRGELALPEGASSSPGEAIRLARERLADERRARLVADWVAGLRRRAEINVRPPTP